MADTGVAPSTSEATATSNANPPIDYMIAALLGMPRDQILRGLRDGTVAAPNGAPSNWLPDWATGSAPGRRNRSRVPDPGKSGHSVEILKVC